MERQHNMEVHVPKGALMACTALTQVIQNTPCWNLVGSGLVTTLLSGQQLPAYLLIRDCLAHTLCSQIPPLSALSRLTLLKSGVCEAHSPALHHHSFPSLFSGYKSHVYYPSAGPFAERTANTVQGE